MVLRVLLWIVLGVVVWRFFFKPRPRGGPAMRAGAPAARALAPAETMVDCAHCGVHLPASEALRDGASAAYCSAEHRAAGPRHSSRNGR